MGRAAAAAALAVLLAACGGHQRATDPPRRAAAASCPDAGRSDVDGGRLQMPSGARAGATPLIVVVIPGGDGDGDADDRLGVTAAATRAGFAVLYPTSNDGFWTLNHRQGDADVAAVRGLLDRTLAGGCFDARHLVITAGLAPGRHVRRTTRRASAQRASCCASCSARASSTT